MLNLTETVHIFEHFFAYPDLVFIRTVSRYTAYMTEGLSAGSSTLQTLSFDIEDVEPPTLPRRLMIPINCPDVPPCHPATFLQK
jgi:hypothetical protein